MTPALPLPAGFPTVAFGAYAALAFHALLVAAAVWLCGRFAAAFQGSRPSRLLSRKTEARYWALVASVVTSVLCMASLASGLLAPPPADTALSLAVNLAWLAAAGIALSHALTWREMRKRYGP